MEYSVRGLALVDAASSLAGFDLDFVGSHAVHVILSGAGILLRFLVSVMYGSVELQVGRLLLVLENLRWTPEYLPRGGVCHLGYIYL